MRSLTLSNVVAFIVVCAHIYFQFKGQTLTLPGEIYALILGPYGGSALAKLVEKVQDGTVKKLTDKMKGKKNDETQDN